MYLNILNKKYGAKDSFNKIWKEIKNFEEKRQYLHQLIVYIACNNELLLSPINLNIYNKEYVVDYKFALNLGAGYRIWSKCVIEKYNNLAIIDIDIINYDENICEPLMEFDDINLKLGKINRKDNTLDFIYQRDMIPVYEDHEWDILITEIYRILKNEGFVEIVEYDFVINHTKKVETFFTDIVIKYLIEMFKSNNHIYELKKIHYKLENKFNSKKIIIKDISLPLYFENKFEGICIENLILGIKHIEKTLETIIKRPFNEIVELLKQEWGMNKSYIKIYIIYAQK